MQKEKFTVTEVGRDAALESYDAIKDAICK